MGNLFPSKAPTVKTRIPSGILQEEFRKGFGENLFPKVFPETEPLLSKPKVGLEGGLRINHFHPPDCGGANSDNRHDGNSAPPLASERSERARWRGSEIPEKWGEERRSVAKPTLLPAFRGGIRGSRGMKGGGANEVSLHSPLRSGGGA